MEQRFTFINVNDRFDMTTQEGLNAAFSKVEEFFPGRTMINYDPYLQNGYIEVLFFADPATTAIGDVIYP